MKLKNIELENISRFRGELMGLAIIFVILFHVGLSRTDTFFGLRRIGNIGVDIFFFLSGIGLWYSWTKMPNAMKFLKKRILRIYPAWLFVAMLYYIPDTICPQWVNHGGHFANLIDLIGDITINWDFWLNGELTFWYIPATMMLYLVTPAYLRLIIKHPVYRWLPVMMISWCVMVEYVIPFRQSLWHLEIFWSRVPIYFIGLNFGVLVKEKRMIDANSLGLIGFSFVALLSTCVYLEQQRHGMFPLFLERMLYIPLTITSVILICVALERIPQAVNKALVFIGGISLELYLLHNHFVLIYIERLGWSYWAKFFATFIIVLPFAWLLHKGTDKVASYLEHKMKGEEK